MDVDVVAGCVVLPIGTPVGVMGCPSDMGVFPFLVGVYLDVVRVRVFDMLSYPKDNSRPQNPFREIGDGFVVRNCGRSIQSMISASCRLLQ
jgi:hypothetical protein